MRANGWLLLIIALVLEVVAAPAAWASSADSCYVNTSTQSNVPAECIGSYSVHTSEDADGSYSCTGTATTGSCSGPCFGGCGPACNYQCGSGGACRTHDWNTRKYGMFSSQAMSVFPPALLQWASCQTGRAVQAVQTNVFSRVTSVVKGWGQKLSGLF